MLHIYRARRAPLIDRVTCAVFSQSLYATSRRHDSDLKEKPLRRWRGAVQQLPVEKVSFRVTTPAPKTVRRNFFLTDLLTYFCSLPLEIVYKTLPQIFFILSND